MIIRNFIRRTATNFALVVQRFRSVECARMTSTKLVPRDAGIRDSPAQSTLVNAARDGFKVLPCALCADYISTPAFA